MERPPPSTRAKLRAALLTLVLLVHGLAASPLPRSVKASTFNNPIAKEELKRWKRGLATLGIERSEEQLVDMAVARGGELAEARKAFMTPFRPILRVTGTGQGWGLFTYPNTHPHRLHIDIQVDGQWRTLYRALDPEHDWHAPWFRFRRVRGVYDDNATKARSSYENFVRWMADVAFAEHPEADALRVYMVRGHVTLPGEPLDAETSTRLMRRVTRDTPKVVQ